MSELTSTMPMCAVLFTSSVTNHDGYLVTCRRQGKNMEERVRKKGKLASRLGFNGVNCLPVGVYTVIPRLFLVFPFVFCFSLGSVSAVPPSQPRQLCVIFCQFRIMLHRSHQLLLQGVLFETAWFYRVLFFFRSAHATALIALIIVSDIQ